MGRVRARGKWIDGLAADTPTVEAARAFLSVRLDSVVELLPLAHKRYADDVEFVHQLRVATRRSDAALLAFDTCIKPLRLEKMRRRLRKIRKAAGMARICDVHAIAFAADHEAAEVSQQPVYDALLALNRDDRLDAQKAIDKVATKLDGDKLGGEVGELLERLRTPKKKRWSTLINAARLELPALIEEVRDIAELDMSALRNMHQLRLAGKRLRYAMEIFAPCFDDSFRHELYPVVEEMQERLGVVNDAREIVDRIRGWAQPLRARSSRDDDVAARRRAMIDLALCYRQQCRARSDKFLGWWASFGAGNYLDQLERAVAGKS